MPNKTRTIQSGVILFLFLISQAALAQPRVILKTFKITADALKSACLGSTISVPMGRVLITKSDFSKDMKSSVHVKSEISPFILRFEPKDEPPIEYSIKELLADLSEQDPLRIALQELQMKGDSKSPKCQQASAPPLGILGKLKDWITDIAFSKVTPEQQKKMREESKKAERRLEVIKLYTDVHIHEQLNYALNMETEEKVNTELKKGDDLSIFRHELNDTIETLAQIQKEAKMTIPKVVYRKTPAGVGVVKAVEDKLKAMKEKKESSWVEKGFLSASTTKGGSPYIPSTGYLQEIHPCQTGSKGADISYLSMRPQEKEFLFNEKTSFVVCGNKKQGDSFVLILAEICTDGAHLCPE